MADETRKINVLVQTTQARQNVEKLASDFDKLGTTVGKTDRELIAHDQALTRMAGRARTTARDLRDLREELARMGSATTAQKNRIKDLETQLESQRNKLRLARGEIRALTDDNTRLRDANAKLVDSARQTNTAFKETADAAKKTKTAVESLDEGFHMNALRYALYDVANSFGRVRDTAINAVGSILKTGIEFERNFANVERTSKLTGAAVEVLRNEFLDLQSSIPVTSEDLARIGTLAAQMGVAASEIADFTEVTAKFSATSGISAEESATALARLSQMLATDVKGDYDRLASAILKTGVNAIATEQQIVRGSTQIASIGKVAGLSAQEIVALSSAMSSLGMSPELQRSVITSSFTRILTAVRGSTDQAEKFGKILGLTGREFQQAWEGDGYNTYRKLLAAIASSPNAIGILQDLKLASQRLTPNLLKMGQAYGLLGDTLADTTKGWDEDLELQRQYQVIMDTTAAKLQVLSNTWEAFLTVIGQDAVSDIGDLATGISNVLKVLREFASTPVGGAISNIVIAVGILTAGVFALLTAVTLMGAAFLGARYVLGQFSTQMVLSTLTLGRFTLQMDTAAISGSRLANTMAAVKTAGSLLNAVLVGLVAGQVIAENGSGIDSWLRSVGGLATDTQARIEQLINTQEGVVKYHGLTEGGGSFRDLAAEGIELNDTLTILNRSLAFSGTWGNIRNIDEALAKLAETNAPEANKQFQLLRREWVAAGLASDQFTNAFTDTNTALQLYADKTGASASELDAFYNSQEQAATAEEQQALSLASLAEALGLASAGYMDATDALGAFTDAFNTGATDFFDIGEMINNAYGTGDGQGGGLARFQQDLDANLVSAKEWADGLQQLTVRGASSLAQAFAEQGPKSQQAVAEALSLGPEALAQLEQSMADAAFFASDAYAQAFASESGILAQVYKQMLSINPADALNAVHEVRDAIRKDGGVLDNATLAGLQSKYGFKLDIGLVPTVDETGLKTQMDLLQGKVTPITVPLTTSVGQGDFTVTQQVEGWIVEMEGHSIVLPVDPSTAQGTSILQEWRDNEYQTPVWLQTMAKTDAATQALNDWFTQQQNRILWISIRSNMSDLNGSVSGTGRFGTFRTGGIVDTRTLPKFARGTILRGPGTGTSDSMLARVSTGEAITRAAAVRYYGTKLFDDLNNMRLPRFASGYTSQQVSTSGGGNVTNVQITQNNPVTRDPLKQLREDSEMVAAGIWK